MSKFDDWISPDGLIILEGWARDGHSDKAIAADLIGINEATFCTWKNKYPQIKQALKKGRMPHVYKVENKLLEAALGFHVTVKEPIKLKKELQAIGKGRKVEEYIEYVDRDIYYPPNVTAIIFYLKNTRPDKYKDKHEVPNNMALDRLDEILKGVKAKADESDIQPKAE